MADAHRSSNLIKAEECRQSIYSLINSYISKPNEEWHILLDLIKDTVSICPETFISATQHSHTHQPSKCGFMLWVITSLLRMVSQTSQNTLVCDVVLCLKNILALSKVRDHSSFVYVLQEATDMLSDLSKLSHHETEANGCIQFPLYLSHFQVCLEESDMQFLQQWMGAATEAYSDLNSSLIEANCLQHLNVLATTLLSVLTEFPHDLAQFHLVAINNLFRAAVLLLDCGTLIAKQASLDFVIVLVTVGILPQKIILDQITSCLVAMVSRMSKILSGERSENILPSFQDSLARCLMALFCPLGRHATVVRRFWDHLSYSLHSLLSNGTYPLLNKEMQECSGQLMMHCLTATPDLNLPSFELILSNFGKTDCLQPFVGCLCTILKKLYASIPESEKDLKSRDEIISTKKSKAENIWKKSLLQKTVTKRLSPRALLLVKKVMECARESRAQYKVLLENNKMAAFKYVNQLEGVRCGLEVFARLAQLSSDDKSVLFFWTHDQLNELCRSWELAVTAASSLSLSDKTIADQILCKVIESIGALAVTADRSSGQTLPPSTLDRVTWLATLPWPKTSLPGAEYEGLIAGSSLTLQQCQELKTTLSESCNVAKCRSLSTLAVLPVCMNEAHTVDIVKQALAMSDFDVQKTAIKSLPLLLHSDLYLSELLSDLKKLETEVLQLMFIRQIPQLLCNVSGERLERCYTDDFLKDVCSTCALKKLKSPTCSIKGSVVEVVFELAFSMSAPKVVVALVESISCLVSYSEIVPTVPTRCLALFTHANAEVRHAVSAHVQLFFAKYGTELREKDDRDDTHAVFTKLNEAFICASKDGDIRLQELTVSTYGQIGRFIEGTVLGTCLVALLKFVFERSLSVRAAAYCQIQNLAAVRGLTLSKLLSQLKEPVCQFILKFLHEKDIKKTTVLKKISRAFGFKEMKSFFEIIRDTFIPMLVCSVSTEGSVTLSIIAKELKTNGRSLLLESFKHIFLYLVRNGQQQDLNVAASFIKSEGGFDMTDLMRSDTKNVLNLLLLHLSTDRNRILIGVRMLAEMSSSKKVLDEVDVDGFIADFLEPHLHGVVAFFNFMLVRLDFFENSAKGKLAIGSLIELMKIMGAKRITLVKMKIIAMLRHCLSFHDSEVTELTLSAWQQFIHCVDLESLGPLLGQIVVALYPVIDEQPQKVAEIFNFLIVENRAVLAPYFNEIYLMPESSVLSAVTDVLKKHLEAPRSLREQFRHLLKGVQHERPDVRLHALKSLHKRLKSNRIKLESYMVDSDTVDPVITEIVTTIFRSLRGAGVELREECGRCLGELGAIDPGKLDIPITSPSRVVRFYEIDGDFAVDLFGELARAYLAAINTRSQDCCAFAIQELLSIFDCANSDGDREGARIWSLLPDETREVLRPHFNSTYTASVPVLRKYKSPVFGSTKNMLFPDWIQKWCSILIHKLSDGLPKKVFLPCSLIFQHDRSIALYLLPHVLTCLLRSGNAAAVNEIHSEVMAVLNHSARNKDVLPELADASNMCAQTVFTVIDHLTAWADGKAKAAAVRRVKGVPQKGNFEEVSHVTTFLETIPKDVLAQSAFKCQAYTRSLMYLELFLREKPAEFEKNMGFLQKIYVELDDSDGVAGSAAVNTLDPTLAELILQYEICGNYRDAAACYERAIQEDPNDLAHHEGLLRCMMCQGEFTSALMHVDGLQAKEPNWLQKMNSYRVEASWKLGQWKELENFLKFESVGSKSWDVNLGQLLLAAKQKDFNAFDIKIKKLYSEQMGPLCAASLEQGSYQRGYDYIIRLHMLQELEDGVKQLLVPAHTSRKDILLQTWQARSQLIQESFRIEEPILSLRRVVMGLASNLDKEIGKCWLESARTARKAGHLQVALSLLLNAKNYGLPEFCVEWAEHQRAQGSSHDALLSLLKAVSQNWVAVPANVDSSQSSVVRNSTHADALLLVSQWMEDTAHYDTQTVLKQYKSVITVQPDSEDGHFYLGRYYDRLKSVLASDRLTKSAYVMRGFLQFIIRHYGYALEYGSKYIYQCMPRMLSLWLDFGSNLPDMKKNQDKENKTFKTATSQLNELMKLMKDLTDRLPPYQFLIAFSQLISRICHPNSDVFTQLEAIILKLLEHFPQQSLWMMMAVSKSTHSDRERRCKRILDKAKHDLPLIGKLIDDMVKLSDRLLEVCNKHVEPSKSCSMDKLCRGLARLTNSSDFSSIMVPLQSSMTVTLPTGHGHYPNHQPFPGAQPTIVKFDDKVEVLGSLQRPKKITVLANDGNTYTLLCKPKDDLRKDARLMEFNTLVNKCLRKDGDSRQRRLYIRTYAVVPLNEECGLLEWVHNTQGFRNILLKLYQEKGRYISGRELKDLVRGAGNDPIQKREVFQKELLPRHPPVFGEWFLRTFPDPTAWYSSRLAYAHTVAVMSMVGYILGLGDRHGENILFDSTNGDCVHVDFNCLFNRGETFDVPEVVPFRLTQNMIHGLGVTGYEGAFRKSCEATMKVLRQDSDALICVLKTFIHDPLVEWEKVKGRPASAEATNEKAMKIMRDIEDRLQGKYQKSKGLPLSIEGHVHALIKEATATDNLCQMYVGWAPYL